MPPSPTIILAGGGTGGHLYPGIAVAEALKLALPDAAILFLCTTRDIDSTILGSAGFEFVPQPIVPPVKTLGGLLRFWQKWGQTKELVRKVIGQRQPAAVLGLGGYAAGAAVKIAALRKIPTAILNPDVIPGKANRYLMQYVRLACCQFDATSRYVSGRWRKKLRTTGCPIRADIAARPPRHEAAARLGLDPLLSTLTITGASLGARTVNEAVLTALKDIKLHGWQILHLAGKEHAESVRAGYRELSLSAAVIDFTPQMADVWAVTDLAVSRAGASSCAELTACAIPSILLPYPFHRDMHQHANARVLAQAGAAILLKDHKDRHTTAAKLRPAVESLLYDSQKRKSMSEAAKTLAKPRAAGAVASLVTQMIEVGR